MKREFHLLSKTESLDARARTLNRDASVIPLFSADDPSSSLRPSTLADCSIFSRGPHQIGPRPPFSRTDETTGARQRSTNIRDSLFSTDRASQWLVKAYGEHFVVRCNRVIAIKRQREREKSVLHEKARREASPRLSVRPTWIRSEVWATNFVSHRMPKATTRALLPISLSLPSRLSRDTNHLVHEHLPIARALGSLVNTSVLSHAWFYKVPSLYSLLSPPLLRNAIDQQRWIIRTNVSRSITNRRRLLIAD